MGAHTSGLGRGSGGVQTSVLDYSGDSYIRLRIYRGIRSHAIWKQTKDERRGLQKMPSAIDILRVLSVRHSGFVHATHSTSNDEDRGERRAE